VFVVEDSDHRFRFPVAVSGTSQLRGMVPTLEDMARWTQEVVAFVTDCGCIPQWTVTDGLKSNGRWRRALDRRMPEPD
jgi:hypothetical protein